MRHRLLTLIGIILVAFFVAVGVVQAFAKTSQVLTTSNLPGSALFSDTFNIDGDLSKWDVYGGAPIVSSGWLTLTAAEVQSKTRFSSGILKGVIRSSNWKPQNEFTDSSVGLERWDGQYGNCHYGVVFKANGYLGLLRSKPDVNNDCANQSAGIPGRLPADPYYQDYIAIPNWSAITTIGTVNFTLTWSKAVTLEVSNQPMTMTSLVYTDTSLAIPPHDIPLDIRLYSHWITESLSLDHIDLYGTYNVYLPIVMLQITKTISITASAYPFQNTGITVTGGNLLEFSANGTWNCGSGQTGPNGNNGILDSSFPVPNANLCALVGVIGDNTPDPGDGFLIGSANQITATQSGVLYLGSNDNLGNCKLATPSPNVGSCYQDNQGSVSVSISVK
jgi:hypothetical protein